MYWCQQVSLFQICPIFNFLKFSSSSKISHLQQHAFDSEHETIKNFENRSIFDFFCPKQKLTRTRLTNRPKDGLLMSDFDVKLSQSVSFSYPPYRIRKLRIKA